MAYENIEKLGALLTDAGTGALQKSISANERRLSELMKKLGEMESAAQAARAEEEARRAAEEARIREEAKRAAEEAERAKQAEIERAEEVERARIAAEENAKKEREQAEARKPAPAPAAQDPAEPVRQQYTPAQANRPASGVQQPPRATFRPDARPAGARPPYNGANGARPTYNNQSGARPSYNNGARPPYNGANGARPAYNANGTHPAFGNRPQGAAGRPMGARPAGAPLRPIAPPPAPVQRREPAKKYDKTYVERRPVNKRALVRQQGASIGDFDEEKSGYRKARFGKKGGRKETQTIKIEHAVVTSKEIPIKVLSEKLGISAVEITKRLFKEGIMKTVNESVDYDNAAFIALELGIDLEYKPDKTAEEALFEEHGAEADETLVARR